MDNDTADESSSTGSTSVLRVAGLATLQQVPARVSFQQLGRESQRSCQEKAVGMRDGPAMPTTREVVGTDF